MWAKFLRLDSGIRKQFQREPKSDFVTEKKTLSSQKKNSKLNREKKKKKPRWSNQKENTEYSNREKTNKQ